MTTQQRGTPPQRGSKAPETPVQPPVAARSRGDDALMRMGRWLLAKVWFACLLSGAYAIGRHFGWPQALLTLGAMIGAVALAMAAAWLPIWTRDRPTGIPPLDIGLRVVVWTGLVAGVAALLIGRPAVGLVAGALLLTAAWRTFRPDAPVPVPRPRRKAGRPGNT